MVVRKNTKAQAQTILPEGSTNKELSLRLEKISEQTSLSLQSLLQKWILQEETLIGLMRPDKEQVADKAPISTDTVQQGTPAIQEKKVKDVTPDTKSSKYRKTLIKRVQKLKKEGAALKKIAETLNEEKAPTVSGTGKWYASSVKHLLNSTI